MYSKPGVLILKWSDQTLNYTEEGFLHAPDEKLAKH